MPTYDPITDVSTFTATVNAPLAGQPVTGASVKVGEQALANRTKFLADTKLDENGGTLTNGTLAGTTVVSGGLGPLALFEVQGRSAPYGRGRTTVTDASQTLDVTMGKRFVLQPNPAAPRIIVCGTTGSPVNGETMEFIWIPISGATGVQYTIKNQVSGVICTLVQSEITVVCSCWVEVEWSSGVWKLGANSGTYNDASSTTDVGVVPGAAAA
jgi:hypothetical protein